MITNNIIQFIPQKPPFVMVDALLFANHKKAISSFTVAANNVLCENGFFTEAGLIENIAQTVAAGNGYNQQQANKKVTGGYIAGIKNFEVFFLPAINSVLTTEVVLTGKIFNMTVIEGKVKLNDALVAQCEMKVFSDAVE